MGIWMTDDDTVEVELFKLDLRLNRFVLWSSDAALRRARDPDGRNTL
jgi:hypothetical protein